MTRRVVLLSPGGAFTDALLARLAERGATVDALVLSLPRGARPVTLLRWLRRRVALLRAGRPRATRRVVVAGTLNGPRTARALRRLAPDVVVLARCGLVEPHVLAIPSEGVVNVHPGLLPWIRGNSPVANAVLRQVPLGSTAFRVDEGIDTGAMLDRRLLRVDGTEDRATLRDALFRLWVEMTVDLVVAAGAAPLPPGAPQPARLPLCRTVDDPAELALVDEAIGRGAARATFERWSRWCDPERLRLPPGVDPTGRAES